MTKREPGGIQGWICELHGGQLLLLVLATVTIGILGSVGVAFVGLVQLDGASALRVRALADESAEPRVTSESLDAMIARARHRIRSNEWRALVRTGMHSDSAARIIESKYGAAAVPTADERAQVEIRLREAAQQEQNGKRLLLAAVILTFVTVIGLFMLPWIWFGGRAGRTTLKRR